MPLDRLLCPLRAARSHLLWSVVACLALVAWSEGEASAEPATPIMVADLAPYPDVDFDIGDAHDDEEGGYAMMNDVVGGIGAVVLTLLAVYLVVAFVLIYFAGERQGRAEGRRDPALGARVLVGFLLTLAGQVAIVGFTAFLAAVVEDGGKMAIRLALGVTVGACLAGILPLVIARRIPALSAGATDVVSRKVWGVNGFIAGLASAASVIATSTMLISGRRTDLSLFVVLVVYTVAAVVSGLHVSKSAPSATQTTA